MKPHESFLTRRFNLALQFASGLHHAQFRKGTNVHIAHLMSVAALVLEAGGDEDQAIAASFTRCHGRSRRSTIARDNSKLFGDRVADVVEECSDSDSEDAGNKKSWHERTNGNVHISRTYTTPRRTRCVFR